MKKKTLVVDIGGTHVKLLMSLRDKREFDSGATMTPQDFVRKMKETAAGWKFDVISIGFPSVIAEGRIIKDPKHLGPGWVGFNFSKALGKPVRVINDAAMQALGSYEGGRMLFLGLGTGLGTTLIIDGFIVPMEVQHMPFRKSTFEDYVGERGLERLGVKRWRKALLEVIDVYVAAFSPDYVVLGGGNARVLGELPPNCRLGHNEDAFLGGFRLWVDARHDSSEQ
jgi:predicted NBD/HSP70 family sugar kinase